MPPTPQPEHRKAVDHGGVAVGADQRIGIGEFDRLGADLLLLGPHRAGEIFEIDLMANAGAGRHDAEIVEGALSPFEEGVALAVAVILKLDIELEGLRACEEVDHDRMVDDEIDGSERIDLLRILAELRHGIAHRGQIDDGGNAGEILHQHARRAEGDFGFGLAAIVEPAHDAHNVVAGDGAAILVAQEIFDQHFQRVRQSRDAGEAVLLGRLEAVIGIGLAADLQRLATAEGIERSRGHRGFPAVTGCWRQPIVGFAARNQYC